MSTVFAAKAPKIMSDLIRDFGLTVNQAAGVLGNIGHECGGFILMQEVHPVSGAGGYGWCQWTGPRRKTFFAFCAAAKLSVDSDEGNYAYLVSELRSGEKAAITALKKTTTLTDAVDAFERNFERAGVPAIPSRVKWAQKALDAYAAVHTGADGAAMAPAPTTPMTKPAKTGFWASLFSIFKRS